MTLPRESEIQLPILLELEAAGGQAGPDHIIPRVTSHFPDLTPEDLAATHKSGENKWVKLIHWARYRLVDRGELERFPRGLWTISEKGRERLRKEGPLAAPLAFPSVMPTPEVTPIDMQNIHAEIQHALEELGVVFGKYSQRELREGSLIYDVIWKEDERLPRCSHVFEVQHKGELQNALAKLKHAHDIWRPYLFLITTEERDRSRAQQMVEPLLSGLFHELRRALRILTAEEILELYRIILSFKERISIFAAR